MFIYHLGYGSHMDQIDQVERHLKLHDIRVLMTVIQARSMSKAAQRLRTSQPAISRSISILEEALGVPLLERLPRGVEPTPYGLAIVKRGAAAFDELRQGIKDVRFLADPTAGELAIGCSEAIAAGPVLAAIERLTQRHPRIMFRVVTAAVPSAYRELADRKVEIAVGRISGQAVGQEALIMDTLFEESIVVVAGSQNPLARRRKIDLAELIEEPWTFAPFDNFASILALEAFRARGLEMPRIALITQSLNMRNYLLASGRFVTVLPGYSLMFQHEMPSLVALPVTLPDVRWSVGIVVLRNRSLSPLAQLFIDELRAVVKSPARGR